MVLKTRPTGLQPRGALEWLPDAAPLKPGRGRALHAEDPPLGLSTRRPTPRLVTAASRGGAGSSSAAAGVAAVVAARRLFSLGRLSCALLRVASCAQTHAGGLAMACAPRRGGPARGRWTARPE